MSAYAQPDRSAGGRTLGGRAHLSALNACAYWASTQPRSKQRVWRPEVPDALVRPDLSGVADLALERLEFAGRAMSVAVQDGRGRVTLA